MSTAPEIFVTGMGVVSPIGVGIESFWNALLAGNSGVGIRKEYENSPWPFRLAARVLDFDARQHVRPRKALKVMCSPVQQGCAAANLAVELAGLQMDQVNLDRVATVFGSEIFLADPQELVPAFQKCLVNQQFDATRWGVAGVSQIEPLWMLKYLPNMVASHISIALDARGPSNSICQGDASSLLSIIESAEILRRDWADIAVAGGTGSNIQTTMVLYRSVERLSRRLDDPKGASRPFDRQRDGMVGGEGAAAIVIETAAHSQQRSAKPLAKLAGWSQGFCPISHSDFSKRLSEVGLDAIDRAGIAKDEIDQINAHGLGTIIEDQLEAAAIRAINSSAAVMAIKHNFGNLGAGSGCAELIAGVLGMNGGLIPGAINYTFPDPACSINLARENRNIVQKNMLKMSFSTTGQIAAVVLSKV